MDNSNTANRKGTGYTNLQSLIGANQGNKMGQAIQTGIGGRVNQIQSDLKRTQQDFQSGLDKNKVSDADKTFVDNKLNDPISASKEDATKFQGLMKGQYTGPTGLQNTANVEIQANELNQYGQGIGSAAGRYGLLQRYVGGNKYTQGQQKLDNMLLGQTASGDLKDIRKQAISLSGDVDKAKTTAQAQGQDAAQQAKSLSNTISTRLGTVDDPTTPENEAQSGTIYGDLYNDIKARTDAFNAEQEARRANLTGGSGNYNLTDDELKSLGIEPGKTYYGLNLGNYVVDSPLTPATVQQLASSDDYSKYAALNSLTGRDGSMLVDPTLSGTQTSYGGLDTARLKETIDLNQNATNVAQNLANEFIELRQKLSDPRNGNANDLFRAAQTVALLTGKNVTSTQELDSFFRDPAILQSIQDNVSSGKALEHMAANYDNILTNEAQPRGGLTGDFSLGRATGGQEGFQQLMSYLKRLTPGQQTTLNSTKPTGGQ